MGADIYGGAELLVHVTAPSKRKDDEHYRALASAYLGFQPVRKVYLEATHVEDSIRDGHLLGYIDDDEAASQLQDELQRSSLDNVPAHEIELHVDFHDSDDLSQSQTRSRSRYETRSTARSAVIESPEASFRSITDNRLSPEIRRTMPASKSATTGSLAKSERFHEQSSWQTPPSVVADSQALNNRSIKDFTSPTRVLELYLQNLGSSEEGSSPAHHVEAPLEIQVTGTDSSPVSPQISISHPDPRSERLKGAINHVPSTIQVTGTSTASDPTSSGSVPTATSKRKQPHDEQEQPPISSPTCINDSFIVPSSSPLPASTQIPQPSLPPPKRQPTTTEIHPPPPPTAADHLTPTSPAILTPPLITLAQQLSLRKRYQPAEQTRPLRPLERGYWRVGVDSWPVALKIRAWRFLEGYVGKGRAGWGVWVKKLEGTAIGGGNDRKGKGKMVESEKNGSDNDNDNDNEEWRLYCWGDVVGHVYMLLYLASERCVKGLGAKWIDGGGEVVIRMPLEEQR